MGSLLSSPEPHVDDEFKTIFRGLTDEEHAMLLESCLNDPEHKVMPPVYVWRGHGIIVDGHNQYHARQRVGLKIRYQELDFASREEAMTYAIRVQLARRNLSASQRAIAVAKLDSILEKSSGNKLLASQANTSIRTIQTAKSLLKTPEPKLVDAVEKGVITLTDAVAISRMKPKERKVAIMAVEATARSRESLASLWKRWDGVFGRLQRTTDMMAREYGKEYAEKILGVLDKAYRLRKEWEKKSSEDGRTK